MPPEHIKQIDTNKFEINHYGTPKRLTFLGGKGWVLTIGESSIENLRNGFFKSLKFTNIEEVEMKFPEWKGVGVFFQHQQMARMSTSHH